MDHIGLDRFFKRLAASEPSVKTVMHYLVDKGATTLIQNDDYKFDILAVIRSQTYRIEVKTDHNFTKTGNVGIGYFNRGKPSGISISQADYLFYVLEDRIYRAKTDKVREWLKSNSFKRISVRDDGKIFLIPGDEFKKIFRIVT